MSALEMVIATLLLVTVGELLFLPVLAGVARVRRWVPPLWLWVAMTLPPLGLVALGDGRLGVGAAMLVWVGMGPVHTLVRLGRGRATRRPVRFTLAVLLGTVGLQALVWMLPTHRVEDGFSGLVVLGLTLGTAPLLFSRWGPPSRVRRAVPALWIGMGVLIWIGALLRIDRVSSSAIALPTHGDWAHVLGIGAGFVLVGLLAVRSRRELVAAGAPVVFILLSWGVWPHTGEGVALWVSDAPGAQSVWGNKRPSTEVPLDLDAPASTLVEVLASGPVEVWASEDHALRYLNAGESVIRLRNHRRMWGSVQLVYLDSPLPEFVKEHPPVALEGTVREVLARCPKTCRLDLAEPEEQAAREGVANGLLEELRSPRVEPKRAREVVHQLRTRYARTRAALGAYPLLDLPWDMVGTAYDTDGLRWVHPRSHPEASLQIVQYERYFIQAGPLYRTAFEGRVSAWTRAEGVQSGRAVTSPLALENDLDMDGAFQVVIVRDGIVEQLRLHPPSPDEVREMVGIERAERPPIPERTSPFDADVCDAPPATTPRSEADTDACFAGRIRCGETVFGHTGMGTRALATPWYRNHHRGVSEGEEVGEGPEQVWVVDVPPHTVARVDVFQPCGRGLFVAAEVGDPRCPVPADVGDLDGRWSPGQDASWPLETGTHLLIVESADTPQPYAATLHCSTAIPGEQVDTGQPDGLLVDTGLAGR